jgi:hypothetical protein
MGVSKPLAASERGLERGYTDKFRDASLHFLIGIERTAINGRFSSRVDSNNANFKDFIKGIIDVHKQFRIAALYHYP